MDGGVIFILVIIGVIVLIFLFSHLFESAAQPDREKRLLIEKQEKNEIEKYQNKLKELELKEKEIKSKETELEKLKSQFITDIKFYEQTYQKEFDKLKETAVKEAKKDVWNIFFNRVKQSIETKYNLNEFFDSIEFNTFNGNLDSDFFIENIEISAHIRQDEQIFCTTLNECNCNEYKTLKIPCKHMLNLAYLLGTLHLNKEKWESLAKKLERQTIKLANEKDNLLKRIKIFDKMIETNTLINSDIEDLIKKRCEHYPHIAVVYADLQTIHLEKVAKYFDTKRHPAHGAADTIREIKKEAKKILQEKKELEYKFAYIQELFPNINDIFDSGFEEDGFELETEDNTDRVRLFLSEEEYKTLSITERNQLALDNYIAKRKSKWQIGRDYEMYIGYLLEQKGYRVTYTGITKKLEDMGRDLIAEKDNKALIIQCKNWSQEKVIHEKHIFQLYGTVVMYGLNSMLDVKGVFITTTKLSNTAKLVADYLEIKVVESESLKEFPRIKCHINKKSGEKIYHLPFDQQYDATVIDDENEFYAFTVKEAEEKGFRRAFKHKGN